MCELSMTEKYALLLINEKGSSCDLTSYRLSAGIVLGALLELDSYGYLNSAGKLSVNKSRKLEKQHNHLETLYYNISSRSTWSMGKWFNFYCLSPSTRNVKPVINDIISSLEAKKYLHIEIRKKLLKTKSYCTVNWKKFQTIAESYQNSVTNCVESDEIIFITQMLSLAGALNGYFSGTQRYALKSAISRYKRTDIWKMLKTYTNKVENFEYQNAVNTGVFYNS